MKRNDDDFFLSSKNNQFILDNKAVNLSANNWYLIKLQLTIKDKQTTISRFHFDYGPGFDTENTLELLMESGIANTTVLFTKHPPVQIKFEAIDREDSADENSDDASKDWFEINTLQFIPINSFFAKTYMLNTLYHREPRLAPKTLRNKISTKANERNISFIDSLLLSYKNNDNTSKNTFKKM